MPIGLCGFRPPAGQTRVATFDEQFLDEVMIENLVGVVRSINRPSKHGSNPLLGNSGWTWDRDIDYAHALQIGSNVDLFYDGIDTSAEWHFCVGESTDGESFSRPIIGAVSYGGDTDNNILTAADTNMMGVYYNADLTPKYLGVGSNKNGTANLGVYLWSSSDGVTWSAAKTIYTSAADGNYKEGRAILRRADGRWLVFYIHGGLVDRRTFGAFLSDTTDPTGSWTDLGVLIAATGADTQRYHFTPFAFADGWLGLGCKFVDSTDQIPTVELFFSRDGVNWLLLDSEWFGIGTSGAWDDEMVIPAGGLVEYSNTQYIYYTGFAENHAAALPRSAYVGAVTIPKGRIAGIGSTGELRLKPITLGAADAMTVNCDASGGSLKVELLNPDNSVIYGYSRDDCDTITSDTYGTTVSWQGRGLPASRSVKPLIVLSSASLHGCQVAAA